MFLLHYAVFKKAKDFLKIVLFLRNKTVKYLSEMLLLHLLDH